MKPEETKRLNVRFQNLSDLDLIKIAAAKSGLSVTEWMRRATLKTAEEQVHNAGMTMMLLKNVLLIRRILELASIIPDDDIDTAKDWAKIQAEDAVFFDKTYKSGGEKNA